MTGRVITVRSDALALPLPDCSVDAVITDPPYGLANLSGDLVTEAITAWVSGDRAYVPGGAGFMNREWDAFVPPPAAFDECLRVLKPGGHLLAFASPRTQDLMGLSIRLAGFEIRDSLHWIFGSGYPKGQDIAKSIDRRRDDRARILQVTAWLKQARDDAGWSSRELNDAFGYAGDRCSHWTTQGVAAEVPNLVQWARLRELLGFNDADILPLVEELNERKGTPGENWSRREVIGTASRIRRESDVQVAGVSDGEYPLTDPAADDAKRWKGWNTALKPAHEPVIMARKTTGFHSTAANVLMHGTGAVNVDACRVGGVTRVNNAGGSSSLQRVSRVEAGYRTTVTSSRNEESEVTGRWPPNVLLGPAAADELDQQSGLSVSRPGRPRKSAAPGDGYRMTHTGTEYDDSGGASRFFPVFRYVPKAPSSERPRTPDGTTWPTVKPVTLLRWMLKLVVQPGGVVLDPFCGTGSLGEAALLEGFDAILADRDPQAIELTQVRLSKPVQPDLFTSPDLFSSPAPPGTPEPEPVHPPPTLFDIGKLTGPGPAEPPLGRKETW